MGLIYFEGEFVSGMTIPMRLSDGWKTKRNEKFFSSLPWLSNGN